MYNIKFKTSLNSLRCKTRHTHRTRDRLIGGNALEAFFACLALPRTPYRSRKLLNFVSFDIDERSANIYTGSGFFLLSNFAKTKLVSVSIPLHKRGSLEYLFYVSYQPAGAAISRRFFRS